MSADVRALNIKTWDGNFGLGKFLSSPGGTSAAVAARWLGLTMPGATGQSEDNAKGRIGLVEPGAAAQSTAVSRPQAATVEAISTADRDRILVGAALGGDQSAFSELVTLYQSAVYSMAYRMLGDATEAEDAAQEVFIRAWNQLRTFQTDRRFSTWLLSITSHHCIDLLRRRKPQAPLDDVALYVQSSDPEPDELVLREEQREMVRSLIGSLPDKYRAVTLLRYYGDMSYDEIARSTGLTESAVKTQLHRARRMLAERILATDAGKRVVSNE